MITSNVTSIPVRALAAAWMELADSNRLRVLLECDAALETRIRSEMDFVLFVDDRRDADVIVRVTPDPAHGQIRHYLVRFIGAGRFECIEASTRVHLPRARKTTAAKLVLVGAESTQRRAS